MIFDARTLPHMSISSSAFNTTASAEGHRSFFILSTENDSRIVFTLVALSLPSYSLLLQSLSRVVRSHASHAAAVYVVKALVPFSISLLLIYFFMMINSKGFQ